MNNIIGIEKDLDSLGRLVIPKKLRKQYNFNKRVEIIATEEGLLIRNPQYKLVSIQMLESLSK